LSTETLLIATESSPFDDGGVNSIHWHQ